MLLSTVKKFKIIHNRWDNRKYKNNLISMLIPFFNLFASREDIFVMHVHTYEPYKMSISVPIAMLIYSALVLLDQYNYEVMPKIYQILPQQFWLDIFICLLVLG